MRLSSVAIYGSVVTSVLCLLGIGGALLINGGPIFLSQGLRLFTLEWNPAANEFGILSMVYGTAVVSGIALVLAVPLGVMTALCTSEMLSGRTRVVVKAALEMLAGIPSIVYGLIGIAFLSLWIEKVFDLQSGRTLLTAGILLAIMILPTIVTLCDDAFRNVPARYREAGIGLGFYRFEIAKDVLFPIAKADIVGAVLLGLGRAFGETMAVMLVVGSIDRIPAPWWDFLSSGQTITSKIGREVAESALGSPQFSALIFLALTLVVITTCLSAMAQLLISHRGRLDD